jgi:4'-phosphopantetheinyl transferase
LHGEIHVATVDFRYLKGSCPTKPQIFNAIVIIGQNDLSESLARRHVNCGRLPNPEPEILTTIRDAMQESEAPPLAPAEVHVWEFPLIVSEAMLADCAQLISLDEQGRAARFHFEKDQRKFTVARASMRKILAAYLQSEAQELSFMYSKNGKPALAEGASDIRFNLSHSGEMALLGVARGFDIGVDIELIRPDVETDNLARRFFSPRERESIRALPGDERVSAFFRCWTCKEAFLKAQGVGLSRDLDSFDVEVNPKSPAHLLATRPDTAEADRWSLHDVEIISNYAAALAVEGSIRSLKILRCP